MKKTAFHPTNPLALLGLWLLAVACQKPKVEAPVSPTPPPSTSVVEPTYVPVINQTTVRPVTVLHEGSTDPANAGTQYTALTTAPNGDVYSGWMDEARNLRLLQIKANGQKVEKILRANVQQDKYHVKPSVAVDQAGFVHVAADMHNQPWVYFRSTQPNAIESFESVTPPGILISYPRFFKDLNGELYVSFRHKVKDKPQDYTRGSAGGGVLRYDAAAKTFAMLGGTAHGLAKTLVWVDQGGEGGFYQQPGINLFFDAKNRMHLVATLINAPNIAKTSDGNTHVLYAYSDDRGETFFDVTGKKIAALPLTPATMTTVQHNPEANITANANNGAFPSGKPVVGWYEPKGHRLVKWNGAAWFSILPEASGPSQFVMRRSGELAGFRPYQGFYVTTDEGRTYTKYNFSPALKDPRNEILDAEAYLQTGLLRFQFSDLTETKVRTAEVKLTP